MKRHNFKPILALLMLLLLITAKPIFAQSNTISGVVSTSGDKVTLEGANVYLAGNTSIGTSTDKDGKFTIRNIPSGEQTLVVSYLGYFVEKIKFTASSSNSLSINMRARVIEGREVTVIGTRAKKRETPVAFTNITREDIEGKYDMQDIPLLLSDAPGVYSSTLR